MRVRLGFDDLELMRRPLPGQSPPGEPVHLNGRAVEALLRYLVTEVPPRRVLALVDEVEACSGLGAPGLARGVGRSTIDRIRARLEAGDLVVRRLPRRIATGGPIPVAAAPQPQPPAEEETTWIEILVVDEADQPLRSVPFELVLPDGSRRRGQTNSQGIARYDRIQPGNCELALIEIDAQAWEIAGA